MASNRVTLESFIERSKAIHGDKYDYSRVIWVNTKTKVEIVCPIHGSFWQQPTKHMQKQGCPKCRKNATVTQEEFIARAKEMHPTENYDYSKVDYKNMWTPVEIICPVHGSFFQTPAKHVKTGKSGCQGCPKCRYDKQRATNKERYGVEYVMQHKDFAISNFESKKRNGTCMTSMSEEFMYAELVELFGENNVERNYYGGDRYPYHCDFYIESLDLFIELNGVWFHGPHFFDKNNPEDIYRLSRWKEKAEQGVYKMYDVAIKTWTKSDLEKRQCAIDNNLNYLVFWDSDLTDFHEWLDNYKASLENN